MHKASGPIGAARRKTVIRLPRHTLRLVLRRTIRALGVLALAAMLLAAWRSGLVAPEPTILLRDRTGQFLGEILADPNDELGYWPVDDLPPRVVAATLAIEDRRFESHLGVDPLAAARAVVQLVRNGRRVSGASTLAMQIARMQHPGPRTYLRKAHEALTALFLTVRNGREAILAHYLRIVPYGNRIHGIAYAARRYLDKPVEDLSWAEIAFLTAIPQSPGRMNPFDAAGRERAIARGKRILGALLRRRALPAEEDRLALAQIANLSIPPRNLRNESALHAILHLQALLHEPGARRSLPSPPILTTSLDRDLQDEVTELTANAVHQWRGRGAGNAAVIVLDSHTLDVLAWTGSTGTSMHGMPARWTTPGSSVRPAAL